ncbi:MAG: hypothetical protein D6775_16785, partial [Caldilineae bacterium]
MNPNADDSRTQILIALIVAVVVFTLGLLGIALGLRTLNQRVQAPTATVTLGALPITPLALATLPPDATPTPTPSPTP